MEQLHGVGELRQLDREIGNELLHLESVRSLKEVDLIRVELHDCQNRIFNLSESVENLVQDVNSVAVSSQKQVSRGLAQMARCVDMVQQSVQSETAKRQEEINNLSMNVSDMLAQSGAKLREEITALSVEISTVRTERSRDSSVGHSVERSMNSAIGFVEAASVAKLREEMTALSMELLAVRNDVSIEIEAACLAKLREDMTALADVSALRAEHMAENEVASMTKLREDLTVLSTELLAIRTDGSRAKDAVSFTKLREDLTALSSELATMRTDGFRAIEASCLAKLRHDRRDNSTSRDNSTPPGDIESNLVTFREEFSALSRELSAARNDSSREIRNEMKELLDVVAHEEILRAEHKEQTGNELQELLAVVAREELIRTEGNESLGLELQELRDLVGIEEQQRAALQEAYDSCLHEQDCADLIDYKQTKIREDLDGLRQYAAFSEEMQAGLMKDVSSVRAQQLQHGKELSDRIGLVNGTVDAKTSEMQACCSALSSDVAKMSQAFLKLTQKFSALRDETPAQRHALEAESVTDAFLRGKVDTAVLMNSDVWLKRTETSKASVADSDTSEGYSRSSVTVPRSDDDKEHIENISFSTSPRNQFRLDCRQVSRPVPSSRQSFPANSASRFSPRASSRSIRTPSSVVQSPRQSMRLSARENGVPSGETFAAHAPKQMSGDKTDPLQLISRLNALRESMDKADLSDRGASFRRPSPAPS